MINQKKKLNVDTEKNPLSPYGLSKLIGFEIVKSYREMFKLPVFSIIFFNHESNLRKKDFVFKKISNYLKTKKQKKLSLGNIDIKRDWGFSHEYMKIILKIIQSSKKNDYVVATGKTISLRNVVQNQFKKYNLNYKKFY